MLQCTERQRQECRAFASHRPSFLAWHSDGVDVVVGGDGPLQADEHDVVGVGGVDAGRALQAEDAAEDAADAAS